MTPDWDEDFGQKHEECHQRYVPYPIKPEQNLDDCVGMVGGRPIWRGKVAVNPDGSFSPVVEKRKPVELDLTLEDLQFLHDIGIGI